MLYLIMCFTGSNLVISLFLKKIQINDDILEFIAVKAKSVKSSSSGSTRISKSSMEAIIERLKCKRVRNSTARNYLTIWRNFNQFLIRLDRMPNSWEERTALFCAHIIDGGAQSQTVKSYVSAIKGVLRDDNYPWNDEKIMISSLTRACRLENDTLMCRLPIQKGLFELILFELKRELDGQFYLLTLFRALFSLAYYGLMRIGELAEGSHTIKASNIHTGTNKNKILIVLYTSKTHGTNCYPQKIKITSEEPTEIGTNSTCDGKLICPFEAVRSFLRIRGGYINEQENFFIFRDKTTIQPKQVRTILRNCLESLGLNPVLYNTHSFRIGRTVDLWKNNKLSLQELKQIGRWRSNAVYRYLKL